jgi:hypothetical protein
MRPTTTRRSISGASAAFFRCTTPGSPSSPFFTLLARAGDCFPRRLQWRLIPRIVLPALPEFFSCHYRKYLHGRAYMDPRRGRIFLSAHSSLRAPSEFPPPSPSAHYGHCFGTLFRGVLFKYIGHRSEWADIATRIWPPCRADALDMGVLLAMAWSVPEKRAWLRNNLPLFRWGMFACSGLAILFAWMAEANLHHSRFLNAALGRSAVELACFCLIVFLICRPQGGAAGCFLPTSCANLGRSVTACTSFTRASTE